MEKKQKFGWAWAYNKKPTSMVGQIFNKKKDALKYKDTYVKSGWIGGLRKVKAPIPLTKEEKEDLKQASLFLKKITGR